MHPEKKVDDDNASIASESVVMVDCCMDVADQLKMINLNYKTNLTKLEEELKNINELNAKPVEENKRLKKENEKLVAKNEKAMKRLDDIENENQKLDRQNDMLVDTMNDIRNNYVLTRISDAIYMSHRNYYIGY